MIHIRSAGVIAVVFVIAALSSPVQAESAIGQLESITGQTIDRSYTPSRPPTYVKKITLPKTRSTVSRPSSSNMAAMNALSTGLMIINILDAMNTADMQRAEAERAMAEAEQKRLEEEQRRQRLISAENLRAFWDGRDREISESLDDVFSLPGQGQGTNFFGVPSNPAVAPSDLSLGQVDEKPLAISGETPTPQILGTGATDVMAPSMELLSEPTTTQTSPLQDGILESGADFAQEAAKDTAKDIMKDIIKSILPTSARNAELMVEHVDKMNEFTGNIIQAIEPQRLVGTLANGSPGDYQAIMNDLDRATKQGSQLGLGENPFSNTMLETGFKLLNGQRISADDAKEIALGKWKGFISDRLKDSLTKGLM